MINFYNQNNSYSITNEEHLSIWIERVLVREGKKVGNINYIFVDDKSIIETNIKYLGHNYPTDIISFDTSEYSENIENSDNTFLSNNNIISGDIFISTETIDYNSKQFKVPFEVEFRRVLIHGILHLIGYDDHKQDEIKMMRLKENESLQIWVDLKLD
ncbi:MAG: rRNA maturation RNase YbeY [Bacteroidales bacterium]